MEERVVVLVMSPAGLLVQGESDAEALTLPSWPLPAGKHPAEAALDGLIRLTGEDAFLTFRKLPVAKEGLHLFQTHPETELPADWRDGSGLWRLAPLDECLPKLKEREAALALLALLD